jgi:hypothetical protein
LVADEFITWRSRFEEDILVKAVKVKRSLSMAAICGICLWEFIAKLKLVLAIYIEGAIA